MAEFHPVRETLMIGMAVTLAAIISSVLFRGDGPLDSFVLLVFLLSVFLLMTGYLVFRWFYEHRRNPS